MIKFEKFVLENGLRVLVHQDKMSSLIAVNILYDVGSRDENPQKTGFAHLFEHLMFGGSVNIPNYDLELQKASAENNAFTDQDLTNYYIQIPKDNLETAFWLESDRMLNLAFSEKSLDIQKNVVIEEYKQNYFNDPYTGIWLKLQPLAYKIHPYKWCTIGKSIEHIKKVNLEEVKDFFNRFYAPNNAILCVSGDIELEEIKKLANKWFGPIKSKKLKIRNLPQEPTQTKKRTLKIKKKNLPSEAIYLAWHTYGINQKEYYTIEIITRLLASGNSSRLEKKLVKEKAIFSSINAFTTGNIDKSLCVISGKINENIDIEIAEKEIIKEINLLKTQNIEEKELQKIKNMIETEIYYSNINNLDKAIDLCFLELLDDANNINKVLANFQNITSEQIKKISQENFTENYSVIYYLKDNKTT